MTDNYMNTFGDSRYFHTVFKYWIKEEYLHKS